MPLNGHELLAHMIYMLDASNDGQNARRSLLSFKRLRAGRRSAHGNHRMQEEKVLAPKYCKRLQEVAIDMSYLVQAF